MAEFDTGMSKARQFVRTLELLEKAIKNLVENGKESHHYDDFIKALNQENPKHAVMNESNTVFYDVTGIGPQKMKELLDECKIPSADFIDSKTGTTVVAVPKQFERQANQAFSKSNEIAVSALSKTPADTASMQKLTANMVQTPSAQVLASMESGNAVTKTFDSARWMPLAQQMQDAAIPFAIVKDSKAGTTSLIFDQQFALSVQMKDEAIVKSKTPAEQSYAQFMKDNLGKPIVERNGLTEGQMREFREGMRGSCAGYNVQQQQNGTYTVRYPAAKAQYIEPVMTGVLVRSNGANTRGEPLQPAMDAHAHYVSAQAEMAHGLAKKQQPMVIADAASHTDKAGFTEYYTVDSKGLRGPDGKIIVRPDDPKFAETVHSVANRMQSPVVKPVGPDGKTSDDIFSRAEIVAAKESHAAATPSDASLMASQIATLKVTTALAQPNADLAQVMNDTANFCRNMSNGIEEENYRLDPEELKDTPSLYGPEKPEKVVEFEDTVHKLQPAEKAVLSDGLRKTSNELSGVSMRHVEQQDLSIDDMNVALDRQEMGHDTVGEHGMDAPGLDDGPVLEGV